MFSDIIVFQVTSVIQLDRMFFFLKESTLLNLLPFNANAAFLRWPAVMIFETFTFTKCKNFQHLQYMYQHFM